MNSQKGNGRIDTLNNANYNIYDLFKQENREQLNYNDEAIKGIHVNNKISQIIFSNNNINVLQDAIRYQVWIKTDKKYVIGRQSDTELKIIIKAIYLEHARFDDPDILREIKRLNMIIIDYCLSKILPEINIYMRYKNDIDKLPIPLSRGEFTSAKGTKTLEMKEF